eukprot:5750754-Prymnesium_polylepis.1
MELQTTKDALEEAATTHRAQLTSAREEHAAALDAAMAAERVKHAAALEEQEKVCAARRGTRRRVGRGAYRRWGNE